MPSNLVYKSYSSLAVSGGILDNIVRAIKEAKEASVSKQEVKSVDLLFRGHRADIVWGKVYVIPPSLCDSDLQGMPKDFLQGYNLKIFSGEDLADVELARLCDSEYDTINKDVAEKFKQVVFKSTEKNRFVPVLVFTPAWAAASDRITIRWTDDEEALRNAVRHLVFGAYYDPSKSQLYDELFTTEDKLDLVFLHDNYGLAHIFQGDEKAYPELGKAASKHKVRGVIAASIDNLEEIKKELSEDALEPEEEAVLGEIEKTLLSAGKAASDHKTATFFWTPGQVLREFYPEVEQGLLQYPAQNNSGMPELKTDISDVPSSASLNPKPTFLQESVPLRQEMQLRGPGFMNDFYRSAINIPSDRLMVASGKTAADASEKALLLKLLQGVCGEIAATLVSAYKITARALAVDVPGNGKVSLDHEGVGYPIISTQSDIPFTDRLKTLVSRMNDGDLQDVLNDSWAQAAIWCDGDQGGFTYEVLVRAEAFDDATLELRYKYVIKTK